MKKKISRTRKFNGEIYYYAGSALTKSKANKIKKSLKNSGFKVRIVKAKGKGKAKGKAVYRIFGREK